MMLTSNVAADPDFEAYLLVSAHQITDPTLAANCAYQFAFASAGWETWGIAQRCAPQHYH